MTRLLMMNTEVTCQTSTWANT